MIDIQSTDFISRLIVHSPESIENYHIIGNVNLGGIQNIILDATITNCVFEGDFVIGLKNTNDQIHFGHCTFKSNVIFDTGLSVSQIVFFECTLLEKLTNNARSEQVSISSLYIRKSEIREIYLLYCLIEKVMIDDIIVRENLTIRRLPKFETTESVLSFNKATIDKKVTIDGFHTQVFLSELKSDELLIQNSENTEFVIAVGCQIRTLSLERLKSKTTVIKDCWFIEVNINEVEITKFLLNDVSWKLLTFSNRILGLLEISPKSADKPTDSEITFANCVIAESSKLLINNLLSIGFHFKGFVNYGTLQFYNSKILNYFHLENAGLGKTHFNNVQLSSSCSVRIYNSHLTETIFSNINLAQTTFNHEYDKDLFINESEQKIALRETYRQLKSSYFSQGKKIESLEFQKRELNMHYEILNEIKCKNSAHFGNYLIIGSNKLASDFGQNIWKPLVGLVLVHLILFNCFLPANDIGYISLDFDWEFTKRMISQYFFTLLPTHPFLIDSKNIGGLWDTLMRIFSGYFIFYFITASRKYHQ